jgi:RNA recognition motif-containing protein
MPPVRLFVGNLAYTVTEAELRELFSGAGQVTQIHLPVDRETGRPRGFAFVEYAERAHAEEAIRKFHNQLLQGRPLSVNEARERGSAPPPRTSEFRPRPSGPSSSGPSGFRPSSDRAPSWGGGIDEGDAKPSRTRTPRTFGDAAKKKGKTDRFEKAPKGPIPVRGGGRIFGYDNEEEGDDESIPFDDIARALPTDEDEDGEE